MPSPFTWNVNAPADTDYRNVYPALDRQDKQTLANVLGTLTAFGGTTLGWRVVQVGNQVALVENASYQVSNQWVLDDPSVTASAIFYDPTDNIISFAFAPAGVSPFTNWKRMAQVSASTSSVNFLNLGGTDTGAAPTLSPVGTDANIGINLYTKGTGTVQVNGLPIAQASLSQNGYLRLGPVTIQWGQISVTVGTANTWTSASVTFPVAFSGTALSVQATLNFISGAGNQACAWDTATATGFRAWALAAVTGTYPYEWLAIGPT